MHDWRQSWRQAARWSRTFLVTAGSVILTLLLLAGLLIWGGSAVLDRWLHRYGIDDWSIRVAAVSRQHLVVEHLSLTMRQPDNALGTDDNASTLTINELATFALPPWLPDNITIREFVLRGERFAPYQPIVGELSFVQRPLQLQVKLNHPQPASLNLSRQQQRWSAKLNTAVGTADAFYQFADGQFADGQLAVTAQLNAAKNELGPLAQYIGNEQVAVTAMVKGRLSPALPVDEPELLLDKLTADIRLAVPGAVQLTLADAGISSTIAGNIQLELAGGSINRYQLDAVGQLQQLPSLPLAVDTVDWQLSSSDNVAIAPLKPQQWLAKPTWPMYIEATPTGPDIAGVELRVNGQLQQRQGLFRQFDADTLNIQATRLNLSDRVENVPKLTLTSLNLPLTATITPTQLKLRSADPLSTNITSNIVDFNAVIDNLSSVIDLNNDANSTVSLTNTIREVRIHSAPLGNFNPILQHEIRHRANTTRVTGSLRLSSGVTLTHDTQLKAAKTLTSDAELTVNHLGDKTLQQQLAAYRNAMVPLLTLNDGSINANFKVNADIETRHWQVSDGDIKIQHLDAIYDTTAIADASLSGKFSVSPEQLQLTETQLAVASIQQGFSVGPLSANIDATLPFNNITASRITLNRHRINAFSGSLSLPNQTYQLTRPMDIPIVFENISLGELMRQYPTNKVAIDGRVSGTLPLHWDTEQLTVNKGYISAVAPGGLLQVDSSALRQAVGSRPRLQTAVSVLENFYYHELSSVIDYDADGELTMQLQLVGYNPAVENGRTVKLNINIEEDLPALIKGLQLSNSVSEVIRQRIQRRIN